MSHSWLFGGAAAPATNSAATNDTQQQQDLWSSWTDAAKWQEFAAKTQQDATKLAEVASVVAAERAAVMSRQAANLSKEAAVRAAELSKQAAEELRTNYSNPEELSSQILQGLGMSSTSNVPGGRRRGTAQRNRNVSLEQLDFTYLTENVASMTFPFDPRVQKRGQEAVPRGMNDIMDVASYLEAKHKGHYMVLNISEEPYDYALFDNQVLEYRFPGHPAPPLGVLFKICVAIESWLDADARNLVVIHCLTGKGRTAALTSCVLAWMGEFTSPMEALHYICTRRNTTAEILTIPSQRRYIQYFGNMLDGIKPRSEPILLRRVIMNTIPRFEKKIERVVHRGDGTDGGAGEGGRAAVEDEVVEVGCAPYVQLFKNGNLIATATAVNPTSSASGAAAGGDGAGAGSSGSSSSSSGGNALLLTWIGESEGSTSFTVNTPIRGDILLRCRHADGGGGGKSSGGRISMFRAALHTGYVPAGVLRLTKEQLDGSGADPRFDDNFFIDLIFAPVVKATPAEGASGGGGGGGSGKKGTSSGVVLTSRKLSDEGLEIIESSEKYEASLHRDARFWESIANRKQKAKKRRSRKFTENRTDHFIIDLGNSANGGGDDEEGGGEGNGGRASGEGEGADGGNKAPAVNSLLISDEDLLAQLEYAENLLGGENSEMGDSENGSNADASAAVDAAGAGAGAGGGNNGRSSPTSFEFTSGTGAAPPSSSADSVEAGSADTDAVSVASTSSSMVHVSASITPPAPVSEQKSAPASSANKELQALEDLERELGLGDMGLFANEGGGEGGGSGSAAAGGGAESASGGAAGGAVDDEDSLEELEKYLQSINSK